MKKRRKNRFKDWHWTEFLLIALVVALVVFIAREAKKEVVSWEAGPNVKGRRPSSIQHDYDYSGLTGQSLSFAAKQRLLSALNIDKDQTARESVVQLGNFVMLNERREKDFVCGIYNHVTLSFEAEGVAVSGEKPTISIDTPCSLGNDVNALAPIKIPFEQIKAQSPKTREFVLSQEAGPLHVQASNNPEAWPRQWSLVGIKMTHDNIPSRVLNVSRDEILSLSNKPVYMKW